MIATRLQLVPSAPPRSTPNPALAESLRRHLLFRLDLSARLDMEHVTQDNDPRSAFYARVAREELEHASQLEHWRQAMANPGHGLDPEAGFHPRPLGPSPWAVRFLNWLWHTFDLHAHLMGLIAAKLLARSCIGSWRQTVSDAATCAKLSGILEDLDFHRRGYSARLCEDAAGVGGARQMALRCLWRGFFRLALVFLFFTQRHWFHGMGMRAAGFVGGGARDFEKVLKESLPKPNGMRPCPVHLEGA